MSKTRANVDELKEKVLANLAVVREGVDYLTKVNGPPRPDTKELRTAMDGLEFYVAVTLRILAKTNPSKIHSEAMTQEIANRLAGKV